ncbi:MAG TPA: hypothetical protein VFP36_10995 [Usitatibacter sp.]|nr:hypothetical protein [Usitatibacter sp.]
MSSFAINGRIVPDGPEDFIALVHARPAAEPGSSVSETRRQRVHANEDARMRVLELVATLAREIHRRGDHVSEVEIE